MPPTLIAAGALSGYWPLAVVVAGGCYVFKELLTRRRREPLTVLITGAGGHIGYSLTTLIAQGLMLGQSQPVVLHLLDVKAALGPLEGLRMELLDLASPLLAGVLVTADIGEACRGVDVAVMLAGAPRRPGADRREVVAANVPIYKEQAAALEAGAAPGVKVVVVASPANTNAWVLHHFAPSIPAHNITCLSRLDHNRTVAQVAARAGAGPGEVEGVVVWGNHSSAQFPDARWATVRGRPAGEAVADPAWLTGALITHVQQRGQAIMQMRMLSSAASAAAAICNHVRDWLCPRPLLWRWRRRVVSMGVMSGGAYGVPPGIFFSFPVRCGGGAWEVDEGFPLGDEYSRGRLQRSALELLDEKQIALAVLGPGV